jgi:hypothetical protein
MKAWLYVGAKVVCVNNGPLGVGNGCRWAPGEEISEGEIYTISEIRVTGSEVDVRLVERTRHAFGDWAWGYAAERFRPVSTIDTTKTVEALKKLVEKTNVPA